MKLQIIIIWFFKSVYLLKYLQHVMIVTQLEFIALTKYVSHALQHVLDVTNIYIYYYEMKYILTWINKILWQKQKSVWFFCGFRAGLNELRWEKKWNNFSWGIYKWTSLITRLFVIVINKLPNAIPQFVNK